MQVSKIILVFGRCSNSFGYYSGFSRRVSPKLIRLSSEYLSRSSRYTSRRGINWTFPDFFCPSGRLLMFKIINSRRRNRKIKSHKMITFSPNYSLSNCTTLSPAQTETGAMVPLLKYLITRTLNSIWIDWLLFLAICINFSSAYNGTLV